MNRLEFTACQALICCAVLLVITGCISPAYLGHITAGELRSLARSRPIDRVLAASSLPPDEAAKLRLVQNVRDYARDCIGMRVARAYMYYEDNTAGPVAYAVSGACQDRLQPYKWTYPIIGAYEAKGFFDASLARKEAERLRRKSYDAAIGEVSGFSTMGVLPDPIRSSNLRDDEIELAILVFHELTHNTVFKPGDTQFNESMATFIGRCAAEEYFRNLGERRMIEAMQRRREDLDLIDRYVTDLYDRLDALYNGELSTQEKCRQREQIFRGHRQRYREIYEPKLHQPDLYATMPGAASNNATVIAAYRYHNRHDLDLFAEAYAESGRDLRGMLKLLASAAKQKDSMGYLRDGLIGRSRDVASSGPDARAR